MRYAGLALALIILIAVFSDLFRGWPAFEAGDADEIATMWEQIWPAAEEVGAELLRIDPAATVLVFPDVIWAELTHAERIGFVQGAQHAESKHTDRCCLIALVLTTPDNIMVALALPDGTVIMPVED